MREAEDSATSWPARLQGVHETAKTRESCPHSGTDFQNLPGALEQGNGLVDVQGHDDGHKRRKPSDFSLQPVLSWRFSGRDSVLELGDLSPGVCELLLALTVGGGLQAEEAPGLDELPDWTSVQGNVAEVQDIEIRYHISRVVIQETGIVRPADALLELALVGDAAFPDL